MSSNNPFGEAREPATKKIDGLKISITPMKGRQANRAAYRFGKAVGPALAALAGDALKDRRTNKNPLDVEIDFGRVISDLFRSLPMDEYEDLMDELLETAELAGNRLNLDSIAFVGKPELAIKVATEVAQYQFSGFFSGWLPKIQSHLEKFMQPAQDPSPQASQS